MSAEEDNFDETLLEEEEDLSDDGSIDIDVEDDDNDDDISSQYDIDGDDLEDADDEEEDANGEDDGDDDDNENNIDSYKKKSDKNTTFISSNDDDDDDDEDDDDDDDEKEQKFSNINKTFIEDFHHMSKSHNYDEIKSMCNIVKNSQGIIVDPFHKTLPILTKYERTRILGQRAVQINNGAKPLVENTKHLMDGYLIAMEELKEKKIPFIIRRPIPGGGSEYWRVSDLEILSY